MKKVTNNKDFLEAVKKSKKGETIIFDEAGNIFGLDFIIKKTSKRECLLCETNLDKEIGIGKWHISLCKKHRMEELNKISKDVLKCKECGGKITIFAKGMLPCCSKCGSYNYDKEGCLK